MHFIKVDGATNILQQFHDVKFMELQCIVNHHVNEGNARLVPEDLFIYKQASKTSSKPGKRVVAYKAPYNSSIIYIISGKKAVWLCSKLGDEEELAHLITSFSYEASLLKDKSTESNATVRDI